MFTERSHYYKLGQKVADHSELALIANQVKKEETNSGHPRLTPKPEVFISCCIEGECMHISPQNAKTYIILAIKGDYERIGEIASGKVLRESIGVLNEEIPYQGDTVKIKDILTDNSIRPEALLAAVQTISDFATQYDMQNNQLQAKHTDDLLKEVGELDRQCRRMINNNIKLKGQTTPIAPNNPLIRAAQILLLARRTTLNPNIKEKIAKVQELDGRDVALLAKAVKRRGGDPRIVWTGEAHRQVKKRERVVVKDILNRKTNS